jgi:hypothetical protein
MQQGVQHPRAHLFLVPHSGVRIPVDVGSDSVGMWAPKTL